MTHAPFGPPRDPFDDGTQLMAAAASGDLGALRALLAQGASPDSSPTWGVTALDAAARWGQTHCAKILLDAGANPAGGGGQDLDPATTFAALGLLEAVILFFPPGFPSLAPWPLDAMHAAAKGCHRETVAFLATFPELTAPKPRQRGMDPLMASCFLGDPACVDLSLAFCDPRNKDSVGRNAAAIARANDHLALADRLDAHALSIAESEALAQAVNASAGPWPLGAPLRM